jgi:hypothetical protein
MTLDLDIKAITDAKDTFDVESQSLTTDALRNKYLGKTGVIKQLLENSSIISTTYS